MFPSSTVEEVHGQLRSLGRQTTQVLPHLPPP